jgi:hypothetical protein
MGQQENHQPKENRLSFLSEVENFVSHVSSLKTTHPLVMSVIRESVNESLQNLNEYLENNASEKNIQEEGTTTYIIPTNSVTGLKEMYRQTNNAILARKIVPRSFFVSLISLYDAYLGGLIRVMFHKCPQMLNSSDRNMTFSRLVEFGSIKAARDFIVEQEIESVLRESHAEQIRWFERRLKIPLTKNLEIWPDFIELTERRNLFVHTDGIVSSQYLRVCQEHDVNLDNVQVGAELHVREEYFEKAIDCVFEMGTKLGHVIWRKLAPEERDKADNSLNDICYDLLSRCEYELAIKLLTFATETIKKHSSEEIYFYLLINRAQALKWAGKPEESVNILESVDWSAKDMKFKLARHILLGEYDLAAEYMKRMGAQGQIPNVAYRDWPLFREFRESEVFLDAYQEIFGEEFEQGVEQIEEPRMNLTEDMKEVQN